MMSKAVKLSIQPEFDFLLIGLVTSEPIYRLSYLLNEALQIQLTETDHIKIYHSKRNVYQGFESFGFFNETEEIIYALVQNKGMQGLLVEEQKQVDFWLKIENEIRDIAEIISAVKGIKNISLAFEIKPDSIKSKNRLLFSNESE